MIKARSFAALRMTKKRLGMNKKGLTVIKEARDE
jgi:hypothetical protein